MAGDIILEDMISLQTLWTDIDMFWTGTMPYFSMTLFMMAQFFLVTQYLFNLCIRNGRLNQDVMDTMGESLHVTDDGHFNSNSSVIM